MLRVSIPAIAAWLCTVAPAWGQTALTFEETVSRARAQAAAVRVALARIAEADAAVIDAAARFRDNPVFEGGGGPRTGSDGRTTELDLSVSQQFETGGQRQARRAGALAAVDRQRADSASVVRTVVFDAATLFLDGLAAAERLRVAEETDAVSRQLLAATERRYAVGDVAAIDLNLSRINAARSAAVLNGARTDLAAAVGGLRALLRIPGDGTIELRGSLDLPPAPPIAQLQASIEQRPEFAALAAEAREADAQARLGRALTRPDLGIRVGYEREETDSIVFGGVTVVLPMFQRGQGTLAAGLARTTRTRLQLETARESALAELQTAYAVYEQRAAVATALTRDALPSVADNQGLAQRSYEAGEMALMDLLLVRRDALETQTLVIERRLEAARSRLNLDYIAGVLR
jgi:cobalt-zinc-cadmium efflux system outer membrane protein